MIEIGLAYAHGGCPYCLHIILVGYYPSLSAERFRVAALLTASPSDDSDEI